MAAKSIGGHDLQPLQKYPVNTLTFLLNQRLVYAYNEKDEAETFCVGLL
jgi:hypothetical protein